MTTVPIPGQETLAGTAVIPAWLLATDPAVVPFPAKLLYLSLSLRAGGGIIPNDPLAIADTVPELFWALTQGSGIESEYLPRWEEWLDALVGVGIIALEYSGPPEDHRVTGIRFNLYRQSVEA